jgi:hypothetical protein
VRPSPSGQVLGLPLRCRLFTPCIANDELSMLQAEVCVLGSDNWQHQIQGPSRALTGCGSMVAAGIPSPFHSVQLVQATLTTHRPPNLPHFSDIQQLQLNHMSLGPAASGVPQPLSFPSCYSTNNKPTASLACMFGQPNGCLTVGLIRLCSLKQREHYVRARSGPAGSPGAARQKCLGTQNGS